MNQNSQRAIVISLARFNSANLPAGGIHNDLQILHKYFLFFFFWLSYIGLVLTTTCLPIDYDR